GRRRSALRLNMDAVAAPSPLAPTPARSHGRRTSKRKPPMHEPSLYDATDTDGMTPLHQVAIHGTVEAFESLLEQGAPLEARDRWGRTPLMALCAQGIPHFSPPVWETWPQLRLVHPFPLYLQKIGMALLWQAQVNGLAKNGHAPLHSAA